MIVHSRIEGTQLAGDLSGDPTDRDLFVYLPAGYEESDRRYPTAYLLHALGSSAELEVTPETDGQRWRPPVEDVIDPVFGRMGAAPMIVVIPDGVFGGLRPVGRLAGHRQLRAVRTGRRHPLRRRRPPDDRGCSSRGVFGVSSGGFGSWNLASRNPDVFGAMAVLSADSWLT